MIEYGITDIQTKPSILKENSISKIVDKRKHINIGYFISAKYEDMIIDTLKTIERQEKISKLNKIKKYQDMDFLELGVSDGL